MIGNLRSKGPRKELLQQIYKKGRSYMYLAVIRYVCNTLFYLFILEAAVQHTSILYKQRLDTPVSHSRWHHQVFITLYSLRWCNIGTACCCQLAVWLDMIYVWITRIAAAAVVEMMHHYYTLHLHRDLICQLISVTCWIQLNNVIHTTLLTLHHHRWELIT